jgi:hypothetical protein
MLIVLVQGLAVVALRTQGPGHLHRGGSAPAAAASHHHADLGWHRHQAGEAGAVQTGHADPAATLALLALAFMAAPAGPAPERPATRRAAWPKPGDAAWASAALPLPDKPPRA